MENLIFTIALWYRHYYLHFSVSSHCPSHSLKGPAWPEPPTFLPFLISLSILLPATPCDPATWLPYSSLYTLVPLLLQGSCTSCAFCQESPLPYFSHDFLLHFAFPLYVPTSMGPFLTNLHRKVFLIILYPPLPPLFFLLYFHYRTTYLLCFPH